MICWEIYLVLFFVLKCWFGFGILSYFVRDLRGVGFWIGNISGKSELMYLVVVCLMDFVFRG